MSIIIISAIGRRHEKTKIAIGSERGVEKNKKKNVERTVVQRVQIEEFIVLRNYY